MSLNLIRLQSFALVLLFALSIFASGCSRYSGDAGAERTDQQSEQLRDRLSTTQVDR